MAISGTRAAGDAVSNAVAEIGYDIGATATFADVSTWAGTYTIDPRTGDTSQYKTFAGAPATFSSTQNAMNIVTQCLYTQGVTDPFTNVHAAAIGSAFDVEITPVGSGAASGDIILTSSGGLLVMAGFPAGDANSTAATTFDVTVYAGDIVESAVV